jgi:hypothetical protein
MTTGIIEGLILAAITSVGVVAWWGLKRIIDALDKIDARLGQINGRVGKMETWQGMHERQDDERHEHIDKATDALWVAVRGR